MATYIPTTPFGRRPITLESLAHQAPSEPTTPKSRSKAKLLADIQIARNEVGLKDRAIAVLRAILSCSPGKDLSTASNLTVFASNRTIRLRADGISEATLRRHLTVLIEAGFIARHDSPNGKRFLRAGAPGGIPHAYGLNLAPLLARAEELDLAAKRVSSERAVLRTARDDLTTRRRDASKYIDLGNREARLGGWVALTQRYGAIVSRVPRAKTLEQCQALAGELDELLGDLRSALAPSTPATSLSGNDAHRERHKEHSNAYSPSGEHGCSERTNQAGDMGAPPKSSRKPVVRLPPLDLVLRACPDIQGLAGGGTIRSWNELFDVAARVTTSLRVSRRLWIEATATLGECSAAATVACILQHGPNIQNGGAYLRTLLRLARSGKFAIEAMLFHLLRARARQLSCQPKSAQSDTTLRALFRPPDRDGRG